MYYHAINFRDVSWCQVSESTVPKNLILKL